jgi:hypothetical protein
VTAATGACSARACRRVSYRSTAPSYMQFAALDSPAHPPALQRLSHAHEHGLAHGDEEQDEHGVAQRNAHGVAQPVAHGQPHQDGHARECGADEPGIGVPRERLAVAVAPTLAPCRLPYCLAAADAHAHGVFDAQGQGGSQDDASGHAIAHRDEDQDGAQAAVVAGAMGQFGGAGWR